MKLVFAVFSFSRENAATERRKIFDDDNGRDGKVNEIRNEDKVWFGDAHTDADRGDRYPLAEHAIIRPNPNAVIMLFCSGCEQETLRFRISAIAFIRRNFFRLFLRLAPPLPRAPVASAFAALRFACILNEH